MLSKPGRQSLGSQRVTVLGSTGSIGSNTLDVLARHPEKFELFALTAHHSAEQLLAQCREYQPRYAVLSDDSNAKWLERQLNGSDCNTELLVGPEGLCEVASHKQVDTVMAAIVGIAGLSPTLAAVTAGKKVLLANKEALVVAGALFIEAVGEHNALLLPVDSEHNAIFQCLSEQHQLTLASSKCSVGQKSLQKYGIRKLLLTGSGGPFRCLPLAGFAEITPEQACAHPNWKMGRKISVDSATMMNKGLELIEACWLFGCDQRDIEIVVHPQSVVHSMVEYLDGSVVAQMGQPDMRTPIAYGLGWPQRIHSSVASLNWSELGQLTFEKPDFERFPALQLARSVATDRAAAVVLNAANEVAVEAFLRGQIRFPDIVNISTHCVEQVATEEPQSLDIIQAIDSEARAVARSKIACLGS